MQVKSIFGLYGVHRLIPNASSRTLTFHDDRCEALPRSGAYVSEDIGWLEEHQSWGGLSRRHDERIRLGVHLWDVGEAEEEEKEA